MPRPSTLPKTEEELRALLEKTWQEACDAELERADEEYRWMRDAVLTFDAVVEAGKSSWDKLKPPRLQGCSAPAAAEFAQRIRHVLDNEPRLKALDAFEAAVGLKIDDNWLLSLDAKAVRALREEPGAAGLVLNNLRISLEQLDAGRKHILGVVERMEKAMRENA
jgi:hypothetical protein